jgi:hypothetical protein
MPVGTIVHSEFEIIKIDELRSICEHVIVSIELPKPQAKAPAPPKPLPHVPDAPLTVEQIVQRVEQRKQLRAAIPKEDEPVSEEIVERAKVPPKIKSDFATAPAVVQAVLKVPLEQRFDGDLSAYSPEEIEELTQGPRVELQHIGGGKPTNPFDSGFDVERPSAPQQPGPKRKKSGPVSVFDS